VRQNAVEEQQVGKPYNVGREVLNVKPLLADTGQSGKSLN
jgi:hypothetical protein